MHWYNHGQLFVPKGQYNFFHTHGVLPTALVMNDKIRIYFATRPKAQTSMISFLDVSKDLPFTTKYLHTEAILALGESGAFDCDGMWPADIIHHNSQYYLYYTGICCTDDPLMPYITQIGLAISDDGVHFNKFSTTPIIACDECDPVMTLAPHVYRMDKHWEMLYVSGYEWVWDGEKREPCYHLKKAISNDGMHWQKQTDDFSGQLADIVMRPRVFVHHGQRYLFYCHRRKTGFHQRGGAYQIACAKYIADNKWEPHKINLSASKQPWDSEMTAYPELLVIDNKLVMFYCGNEFGKDGFGYASCDVESFI